MTGQRSRIAVRKKESAQAGTLPRKRRARRFDPRRWPEGDKIKMEHSHITTTRTAGDIASECELLATSSAVTGSDRRRVFDEAAIKLRELAAEIAKRRLFLGWRVRYELQREDGTWAVVRRPAVSDLRDACYSARYLRDKGNARGNVREVKVMRVYRKPRALSQKVIDAALARGAAAADANEEYRRGERSE